MWIYQGLVSSLLLGFYDICKKHSLDGNAVLPVLFGATLSGFLPLIPFWAVSRLAPAWLEGSVWLVPAATLSEHLHLFAKSGIVAVSWVLAYFAMKHLPISIVSPIRASGPVWTLIGALLLFQERPAPLQWAGMALIFASYWFFSRIGLREGLVFHRNRWIFFIFLATFVGSLSTLYDKYLIQRLHYPPMLIQFWYDFYLTVLFALITGLLWWPRRRRFTPPQWRATIPLIGLLLTASDLVYFHALRDPSALIMILSVLRRSSVVVSFAVGGLLFRDLNRRRKAWALTGVLAGVLLILLS